VPKESEICDEAYENRSKLEIIASKHVSNNSEMTFDVLMKNSVIRSLCIRF